MRFTRRGFIEAGILAVGLAALPSSGNAATGGFTHSVASGDPTADSIVLWTRYVAPNAGSTELLVELADDARFARVVSRGRTVASVDTDFCAHAVPTGLRPGRWYFYRFTAPDGSRSPVGRTRTLPTGPLDRFKIGVFGCANATSGWFTAYAHAAASDDLDLLVHTGDYIYESPTDRSDALAELALKRDIQPRGEAVTIADYRQRYASYRADIGLADLHRRYPMIAMWDDHETANNSWPGGAKNHGPNDGDWDVRKAAGVRAFREWLPTRARDYDRYQIGDLATLFRLETRLVGRTRPLELAAAVGLGGNIAETATAFRDGPLNDPARSMMGPVQERWLADALKASTAERTRWQVIAQQTVMAPMQLPPLSALFGAQPPGPREQAESAIGATLAKLGVPVALDRWDGYPAARRRLFAAASATRANLVVLSGDSHNAWASELGDTGRPLGIELAGHSVSSLGLEKRFAGDPAKIASAFIDANPALRWCDTSRRGYMVLDLERDRLTNEWLFLTSRSDAATTLLGSHKVTSPLGSQRLAKA